MLIEFNTYTYTYIYMHIHIHTHLSDLLLICFWLDIYFFICWHLNQLWLTFNQFNLISHVIIWCNPKWIWFAFSILLAWIELLPWIGSYDCLFLYLKPLWLIFEPTILCSTVTFCLKMSKTNIFLRITNLCFYLFHP